MTQIWLKIHEHIIVAVDRCSKRRRYKYKKKKKEIDSSNMLSKDYFKTNFSFKNEKVSMSISFLPSSSKGEVKKLIQAADVTETIENVSFASKLKSALLGEFDENSFKRSLTDGVVFENFELFFAIF